MNSNDQLSSSSSPVRSYNSRPTSQLSKIELKTSALDSKKLLASQMGLPLLDTISSNESRYANSPNLNLRSHLGGGGGGLASTQIYVPPLQRMPHFESLSYSGSTEFGQHSMRSSVDQQLNTIRGFSQENQSRGGDQPSSAYQPFNNGYNMGGIAQNIMILEDSKEDDISFNKTLTGQSPIPIGQYAAYTENKSSVGEGTRSLLKHMRLGSQDSVNDVFKNSTLGGPMANTKVFGGGVRENYNIQGAPTSAMSGKFANFHHTNKTNTNSVKGSSTYGNPWLKDKLLHDQELLDELSKTNMKDSLMELNHRSNLSSQGGMSSDQFNARDPHQDSPQNIVNDHIKIDDNQFVTLSQVQDGEMHYKYQEDGHYEGGRPSNISNMNGRISGGGFNQQYQYSDGCSSSNPTTVMNTPNQNYYMSRLSPYMQPGGRVSNSNTSSQKCECCKGTLSNASVYRPFSGLGQIETKNLNFIENVEQLHENGGQQTPHLPSSRDQSTKVYSDNNAPNSTYKNNLCTDCQHKMLKSELTMNTPYPLASDLRVSQLSSTFNNLNSQHHPNGTNNGIPFNGASNNYPQFTSSYHNNDENTNLNSNMGGLSSIHPSSYHQNQPLNVLKGVSSLLAQSELTSSNMTNGSQNIEPLKHFSGSTLQDSSGTNGGQSLQYLSHLSQNLGSSLRQQNDIINTKYGLNQADNYKVALKSFMQRQFERSNKCDPLPYSRIFRDRQAKRNFDQLQNIKTSYAQTYEELEAIHTNLLMNKN